MKQGEVKFYNQIKEFGFLKDTDDGKEYFFHKTSVEGSLPRDGDAVEFEGEMGDRGLRATTVKKASATAPAESDDEEPSEEESSEEESSDDEETAE